MFRYINAGPSRGGNGQSKAVSPIPVLILSESKVCYFGKAWARWSTSVVQYSVAHLSIHLEKQRPLDVTFTPSYLFSLSFPSQASWKNGLHGAACPWPSCCQVPNGCTGAILESHRWPSVAKSDGILFLFILLDRSAAFPPGDSLFFWCLRQHALLTFFVPSPDTHSHVFASCISFQLISKCWTF